MAKRRDNDVPESGADPDDLSDLAPTIAESGEPGPADPRAAMANEIKKPEFPPAASPPEETVETPPEPPEPEPRKPIKLVSKSLKVPLAEEARSGYRTRFVGVGSLTVDQSNSLMRLTDALAEKAVRLKSDKRISTNVDAVRWLLEQLV